MNTREREVMDAVRVVLANANGSRASGYSDVPWTSIDALRRTYDALIAEGSASSEYPECSGDPACCPENEGYGCCKPNPSSEGAEARELPLRHKLFCVFAHSSEFNMNVRIPGHIGTMDEVRESVMEKARREGFQGDFKERMVELRWWLVPLYTHPQPAQGEHEQRSCEGSERRPIADEVVLPDLPTPSVYDRGRFGVMFSADQMQAYARAAIESALPRGLPAGSDAKVCDRYLSQAVEEAQGQLDHFKTSAGVLLWINARAAALQRDATAEQPSCGQDSSLALNARDAARYRDLRWIAENGDDTVVVVYFADGYWLETAADDEPFADIFDRSIDAAIAAQQRQGGVK